MYDDDIFDETGYDDEVGADEVGELLMELNPMAAQAWEEAGYAEVGSRKKRRRRILGAVFGGPAGAIAAVRRRRRDRNAAQRAQRARQFAADAYADAPRSPVTLPNTLIPGAGRRILFGLGSVSVPAAGSAILEAVVQRPFQARRALLSGSGLANVVVNDIKIGSLSQLAGTEAIPAETFADVAQDVGIQFDPAGPGVTISVFLSNTGNAPEAVSGGLIGISSGA
jgi:hypothetical protein